MKDEEIVPGREYFIEYAGGSFRVRVMKQSTLTPGWWTCEPITEGAPEMVPSAAFVRFADEGPE